MVTRRILVVDDEIIIARELEARLLAMGFEVPAIAASGQEALRHAEACRPDLVLMDIVLKGDMDGIEAAAEIRRLWRIPVIYLTAYTDDKTLERAKITEPFGYLVKPFSERELRANIEMALYKKDIDARARKLEQWFMNAMEEVPDAVVAADMEGKITLLNQAAENITAWRREEALGQPIDGVLRVIEKSSGKNIPLFDSLQAPLVCLAQDTLLFDKDNTGIPVDITTSCLRDQWSNPNGIVSVFRDATGGRNAAHMALSADIATATSQALAADGMLQLCCDAVVRNLNAAFARVWTLNAVRDTLILRASAGLYTHINGAHARIPVGKFMVGLVASERMPYVSNVVQQDPRIADHEWARQQNLVGFAGMPLIVGGELLGVLAVFSHRAFSESTVDALDSISKTIAVALEHRQLEEQLRHSQKMEAVGLLAGGVAHDFNNLLTVIAGYSEEMSAMDGVSEEGRELAREIGKAADRAAALTRQLLAFSRQQVMNPRVLDLNQLLSDFQRMLRRLLREDVEVALSLCDGLPNIMADPGQIEQVLVNLAVNAKDAMPSGGRLLMETGREQIDDALTGPHPEVPPGDYVTFSVSDNGTGMAPEIIAHIFEPFYTTKELGHGTGLGLSTVYGIVRQSGGYISVCSEPGRGTTFCVYLRCTEAEACAPARKAHAPLEPGTETILIVEDEESVRRLVATVLRRGGYNVLEASDGVEALQISEQQAGRLDLVLTDIVMPQMSGPALARELKERAPHLKVLFMSGYTDNSIFNHTLSPNAHFLQKPLLPGALLKKVREMLDQQANPA